MKALEKLKCFDKFEDRVGGSLFLLMFAILIVQIISRKFFTPLIWSEELARLIFTYVGMLGIAVGIRNQQHVLVDFICDKLPMYLRKIVFTAIQALIFTCLLLFLYYGVWLYNHAIFKLPALDISNKWLYLSLPLLCVLMLIRFFQVQHENFKNGTSFIPTWLFLAVALGLIALYVIKPDYYQVFNLSNYVDLGKNTVYVVLLVWLVIMFLGMPVGWSLFIAAILYFSLSRWQISNFASKKLVDSVFENFGLLSVPFFILTGILMNSSGITTRIFNFARAMLGHYTGGMGHVNISASLIFSGMSGSALADAGGLGQLEIKAMRDAGYDEDLCGGITAASCIIGPLVPPSIAMIIYGVIANQSIAKLFLAGFVPGVLLTILLMSMNAYLCKRRNYPKFPKASKTERIKAFKEAFWALLTPILIIGGIFSGQFSPTEAAVVAALYSAILGLFIYQELSWKKLFKSTVEAMAITGVVVLMVMTVTFFGDMIAREQVAKHVAKGFMSYADTALVVLIMINLLLLFLGMFIDALALQFLLLPMLIPIAQQFNIDLIFFGVMTTLNMMIGILTPPMGMALFVVARAGNMPVSTVTKGVIPFIIPIFIALIVITLFPSIVTFLPNLIMGH